MSDGLDERGRGRRVTLRYSAEMPPLQRIHGRVVLNPQWRQEHELSTTILTLRVDLLGGGDAGIKSYDVEMRGTHIYGFVRAGDEVEVFAKAGHQPLEARAIHNVNSHAWVTADSGDPPEEDPAPPPDEAGVPYRDRSTSTWDQDAVCASCRVAGSWRGGPRCRDAAGLDGKRYQGERYSAETRSPWKASGTTTSFAKRIRIKATGAVVKAD